MKLVRVFVATYKDEEPETSTSLFDNIRAFDGNDFVKPVKGRSKSIGGVEIDFDLPKDEVVEKLLEIFNDENFAHLCNEQYYNSRVGRVSKDVLIDTVDEVYTTLIDEYNLKNP